MNIKSILCPIDFSNFSDTARAFASMFADASGAEIIFLHVAGQGALQGDYDYAIQRVAEHALARLVAIEPTIEGVKFNHEVRVCNFTADTIVKYADEHECDLIVIPTHGRTGLRRIFLGSVAEAVLRKANCAVATIRPESGSLFTEAHSDAAAESSPATKEEGKLSMKPNGVLCAVDVNDYDQDVIDLAADLAKQFGVDLDLLHVTLFPNTANKTVYAYTGDNSVHRKERRRLDAIATEVEEVEIKSHHLLGYPAEQVLRFAQLNQPRLLVLGTHGRTGLARVFGSIASQILRDAACPVMVLRQDQNDQHFTESDADHASDESSASAIS